MPKGLNGRSVQHLLVAGAMFIIQSTGRSGTTYLGQLLSSHPNVQVAVSILHPEPGIDQRTFFAFWAERLREDLGNLSPNKYGLLTRAYLDHLQEKAGDDKLLGLDLKLEQLDIASWMLAPILGLPTRSSSCGEPIS